MLGISNGSCPPAIGASQCCLPGRAPLTDLFISAFIHAPCFNSLSIGTIWPVHSTQEPHRVIGEGAVCVGGVGGGEKRRHVFKGMFRGKDADECDGNTLSFSPHRAGTWINICSTSCCVIKHSTTAFSLILSSGKQMHSNSNEFYYRVSQPQSTGN